MPLYDFRCDACCHVLELYLPMTRAGESQECPTCHGPVRRLYTVPQAIVRYDSLGYLEAAAEGRSVFGQTGPEEKHAAKAYLAELGRKPRKRRPG